MLRERSSCNRTRVPRANAISSTSARFRAPNRIRIRRKSPEYRRLAPPTVPPPHSLLPSPSGRTAASLPAPRAMSAAVFCHFRAFYRSCRSRVGEKKSTKRSSRTPRPVRDKCATFRATLRGFSPPWGERREQGPRTARRSFAASSRRFSLTPRDWETKISPLGVDHEA